MKKFAGILLMLLLLCGAALAENTYHVEEFPIEKEDESVIAGWLYVPDGAENAPAVILATASTARTATWTATRNISPARVRLLYVRLLRRRHAEPKLRCNDGHDPADRTR